MNNFIKAGVAKANITPPVGTIANGGKPSIGIATELYAKALVLDDGQTKAALVTADVILFGKKVVAETRARIEEMMGIPGAQWAPNPDGPVDNTLSVLRIDHSDGKLLAALVDYAAHASVMNWGQYFAADYPGFLQRVVEKVYDDKITVLFANGASGDTKIKWLKKKDDGSIDFAYGGLDDARRWGMILAGEALKVFEQICTEKI